MFHSAKSAWSKHALHWTRMRNKCKYHVHGAHHDIAEAGVVIKTEQPERCRSKIDVRIYVFKHYLGMSTSLCWTSLTCYCGMRLIMFFGLSPLCSSHTPTSYHCLNTVPTGHRTTVSVQLNICYMQGKQYSLRNKVIARSGSPQNMPCRTLVIIIMCTMLLPWCTYNVHVAMLLLIKICHD